MKKKNNNKIPKILMENYLVHLKIIIIAIILKFINNKINQ